MTTRLECACCHEAFRGRSGQQFCSNACRQAAYRERKSPTFDVLRDRLLKAYEDVAIYLIVPSHSRRAMNVLRSLFHSVGSDLVGNTDVTLEMLREWVGEQ